MAKRKREISHKFRVELLGINPTIWRMIEAPCDYSFWDLHVAIQDSMGWLDYHLHNFTIGPPRKRKPLSIGIPDNESDEKVLAGWTIPITKYFKDLGDTACYEYDFGDGWEHQITFEGTNLVIGRPNKAICLEGARACPPEDCGGVSGYYRLLNTLKDPNHEEYENMVYWLSNHAKKYHPYNPEEFKLKSVKFWEPFKRWKMAFANENEL